MPGKYLDKVLGPIKERQLLKGSATSLVEGFRKNLLYLETNNVHRSVMNVRNSWGEGAVPTDR